MNATMPSIVATTARRPVQPRVALWLAPFLKQTALPGNADKPLVLLNPWGSFGEEALKNPRQSIPIGVAASLEFWDQLVVELSKDFRVWQIGFINDSALANCEYYFLNRRSVRTLQRVRDLIPAAFAWIGATDGLTQLAWQNGLRVIHPESEGRLTTTPAEVSRQLLQQMLPRNEANQSNLAAAQQ